MPTDTDVRNLVINVLTQAEYEGIVHPSDTEMYMTDAPTNYVTTNTAQTISGGKAFTGNLTKKSTTLDIDVPNGVQANQVLFKDKNDVIYNFIQSAQFANGLTQFGLACRGASTNSFTELGLYQMPDGTSYTYCSPSAQTNSIVTTLGVAVNADYVRYQLGNALKIVTGRITSATAQSDYTFNYGVTFIATPVVVFGRRTNTTTTSVTTQCWVRGTPGTSSCKIYSNSTSAWSAEVIVIGY